MKIAICISGLASRLYQSQHVLLRQLSWYKDYSHCDLFFNLWNDGVAEEELKSSIITLLPIAIKHSYNIAGFCFRPLMNIVTPYTREDCWSTANSPEIFFSQSKCIQDADLLRQDYEISNNFKYDLVIRTRPDLELVGEINLAKWKKILTDEGLAIFSKNWHWFQHWDHHGMLNDAWYVSNSDWMTEITKLVDNIVKYVDQGCRLHPESLLWWHLKKGIPLPQPLIGKLNPQYIFQDCEVIIRGRNGW